MDLTKEVICVLPLANLCAVTAVINVILPVFVGGQTPFSPFPAMQEGRSCQDKLNLLFYHFDL